MSETRLEGKTILIVDDDEDIRSSIALTIRAEGANVVTAGDGIEAISLCQHTRLDAIILDVMLPRQSGFLVLERIQELEFPPPVVMVTANQGKRHMIYAESLGVKAYLYKPIALQRLVDTVVELCQSGEEIEDSDEKAAEEVSDSD